MSEQGAQYAVASSLQADEQDLMARLQAAGREQAQLERKLGELAAYMLRLEGALVYVQGKLKGEQVGSEQEYLDAQDQQ
jgi:hypothetical protein